MTINNSKLRVDIDNPLAAHDALNNACSMITFLQEVLTLQDGDCMPENITTTGLYFIMQDIKDRILDANVMLQYSGNSLSHDISTKPS